jgi:hypothetical protein
MTTTTLLYDTDVMRWDPVLIVLAHLGLTKELEVNLEEFQEKWQLCFNGWGHIGVEKEIKKDAELFFRTNMVMDVSAPTAEKILLPMWYLNEGQDILSWTLVREKPLYNETVKYHSSVKGQLAIPRMV